MSRSEHSEPPNPVEWSPRHLILGVGAFLIVGGASHFVRAQNQVSLKMPIAEEEQLLKEDMKRSLLKNAKVPRSRGFTLIEVLVVVAILSILAAILFPVLSRARREGQRMTCIVNLKQISQAMMLYTVDADDRIAYATSRHHKNQLLFPEGFPFVEEARSAPTVDSLLARYGVTQAQWHCPEDTISEMFRVGTDRKSSWFLEEGSSYEYSVFLAFSGTRLGQPAEPAKTRLFSDIERFHGPQPRVPVSLGSLAQVVFFDGHVESLTGSEEFVLFQQSPFDF